MYVVGIPLRTRARHAACVRQIHVAGDRGRRRRGSGATSRPGHRRLPPETGPRPVAVGRFAPHRKSEGPSHQLGPSAVDPARGHRQRVHLMGRVCIQVSGGRPQRLGYDRPRLRADLHVVRHCVLRLSTGLPRSNILRQGVPEARICRQPSPGQLATRTQPRRRRQTGPSRVAPRPRSQRRRNSGVD